MQLVTNLDNADDIRASIAFLNRQLAPVATLIESFVDNAWSRIGSSLREMVTQAATYDDWTTIDTLASDLGRPYRSVRSSLNGPLARALKSAEQEVPGAPSLIEWRQQRADKIWEFRLTPEMRAEIAKHKPFDAIPPAE
jgi:hypothetical protein